MSWARGAALAAMALLGACSSEGPTDLGRIGLLAVERVAGEDPAPAPRPSRADLEATGAAILAVATEGSAPGYVAALADAGGYVTYQDAAGRALVISGHAIARTHGFGTDLTGLRTAAEDPLTAPRAVAAWPSEVDREYQYRVKDGAPYSIVLTCRFARGDRMAIEILGRTHEVVEIRETCSNHRRRIENRHWADPETGRLWRSRQWIGPFEPPLTLEIVTPYRAAQRW